MIACFAIVMAALVGMADAVNFQMEYYQDVNLPFGVEAQIDAAVPLRN